jgi:GNAT superfamily N-acetyltransferase
MSAKPSKDLTSSISIRTDLRPGDIGMVIHLHGIIYAEEQGWDSTFDAYVAGPIAEFAKSRSDRDRIWIVELAEGAEDGERGANRIVGSIAIVEASDGEAQLRWLLLAPEVRGLGLGKRLAEEALAFSRSAGYSRVFLWTVRGLEAATSLYESLGFEETEEKTSEIWGSTVTEVRYDLRI